MVCSPLPDRDKPGQNMTRTYCSISSRRKSKKKVITQIAAKERKELKEKPAIMYQF
jgi:hypothetical protein